VDQQAARAWKAVAEHVAAQHLGQERWYAHYRVRVATVEREYGR
jgi:heme-degrading monooxygenase HmoA